MNRLRTKASRFFLDAQSRDEMSRDEKTQKVANASTDRASTHRETHFDAGVEHGVRRKPSRFWSVKDDKPLPAPPPDTGSSTEGRLALDVNELNSLTDGPPGDPKVDGGVREEAAEAAVDDAAALVSGGTDKSLPKVPPASQDVPDSEAPALVDGKILRRVKSRPSFTSLRSASSRIFRSNTYNHDPPPPPMPQIPIDTPTPKTRRPTLRPFDSVRSARSSRSSSGHVISISRPLSSAQTSNVPSLPVPSTVPFTKPSGPPPPRPPRPASLDPELLALMRDGSTRMVLTTPYRARSATTTTTTSSGAHSAMSRLCSDQASTRLGLPSGHPSLSSPRSPIFDSPLAASFPLDPAPSRPLPFRDSAGSARAGRSSAYGKARPQYGSGGYDSGGYADGVETEDRELGPIEQYRESKCRDWMLERRVSGKAVERGMLFRDRWGGWHFVADV